MIYTVSMIMTMTNITPKTTAAICPGPQVAPKNLYLNLL